MDAAGHELADRIRALLSADAEVEERRMFGTRAFLHDGHILLGARPGGVLLVRLDEESGAALLTRPGATRGDGSAHDELGMARRRSRRHRDRR
ncbi:TfoX/Sxy family protein [Microbacterium sp. Se63.02b]|uniref:TfoX/Sxy family protein n=1 Tax=Microbacterium sp. Se63.02b TaxID=2709304 RepID=UPI001FCE7424|nr:TfoX/Sxy family protein [Microbacterium sp. Se63.02b]